MGINVFDIRQDDIVFVIIHLTDSNFRCQTICTQFLEVLNVRFIYHFRNICTHIRIPEDEIDQEMANLNFTYRLLLGRIREKANTNFMIPYFFILELPFHDIQQILAYIAIGRDITQSFVDIQNLCIVSVKQYFQRFFRMRFIINV